jgi:hypothetical protein
MMTTCVEMRSSGHPGQQGGQRFEAGAAIVAPRDQHRFHRPQALDPPSGAFSRSKTDRGITPDAVPAATQAMTA